MLLAKGVWALWSFSPCSKGLGDNLLHPHPRGKFTSAQVVQTPVLTEKGWSRLLGQTWSHTQTEPVLDLAVSRGLGSCSHHSFLVLLFILLK